MEQLTFEIALLNNFLYKHGEEALKDAIFNGAFSNVALEYIHPKEILRETENFSVIQKFFINAYC